MCKKISCSVYSVHNIIYYDKEQLQNYHKQLLTKLDYTFLASNTPLHIYSAWCGNLELSVAFYCRQWNLGLLMACWKQNIEFKVLPFHVCCKIDKVGCIYKLWSAICCSISFECHSMKLWLSIKRKKEKEMILDDGFFKRSLATKVWPEGKKKNSQMRKCI